MPQSPRWAALARSGSWLARLVKGNIPGCEGCGGNGLLIICRGPICGD